MSFSGVNLKKYLIPPEIHHSTENFSHQRCIGGGGFRSVYKAQLFELWQNCTGAVNRLDADSYQGDLEFCNELEMISRFHYENIISFIGYSHEGGEMIIVYEYALKGSLDQQLQHPNMMSCITWVHRLEIFLGAARGLDYLHKDIRIGNILLDGNMVGKLCDFGLSKLVTKNHQDTHLYTKVACILQKESDVYSFGVVLFEVLSGMLVY